MWSGTGSWCGPTVAAEPGPADRPNSDRPDSDTQSRIGSISKPFTAVMVARLRDEGRLDFGDRLETHLPGTPLGDRTIAQLMSHSSGLQAETEGPWWERTEGADWAGLAETFSSDMLRHRAGSRLHYSNVGYAVHPWADVLLPEPAEDAGAMAPAGQLWSTVADLGRFASFIAGDTGDVLDPSTLEEMRQPNSADESWESGFGLGLQISKSNGRKLYGHGGSMPGFLAIVMVDVADRTGSVVMANTTSGVPLDSLGVGLIDTVAELEPRLPDEWASDPSQRTLLDVVGPWYWGPTAFTVRAQADGWLDLRPVTGRGRASRFRPTGTADEWIGLDGYYAGETLRVVRRPDGTPGHLDLATFVFTRTPYDPSAAVPGGVHPDGWR